MLVEQCTRLNCLHAQHTCCLPTRLFGCRRASHKAAESRRQGINVVAFAVLQPCIALPHLQNPHHVGVVILSHCGFVSVKSMSFTHHPVQLGRSEQATCDRHAAKRRHAIHCRLHEHTGAWPRVVCQHHRPRACTIISGVSVGCPVSQGLAQVQILRELTIWNVFCHKQFLNNRTCGLCVPSACQFVRPGLHAGQC